MGAIIIVMVEPLVQVFLQASPIRIQVWLFAGSERAGQRAAVIQTLLGTVKLNVIDPAAWLKDTLEKLPDWPNSRIDELPPFVELG